MVLISGPLSVLSRQKLFLKNFLLSIVRRNPKFLGSGLRLNLFSCCDLLGAVSNFYSHLRLI